MVVKFYGSTVVGERGQIVIPKDGRGEFELEPGTRLLVFGVPGGGLILVKPGIVYAMVERIFSEFLREMRRRKRKGG